MKNIIILLILPLFMVSCGASKKSSSKKPKETVLMDKLEGSGEELEEYKAVKVEREYIMSGSSPVLHDLEDKSSMLPFLVDDEKSRSNQSNVSDQNEVEVETDKPNFPVGKMAFSVPDTMVVGNNYEITLRITKNEDNSVLVENIDRNNNVKSKVVINNIRVSSVMTAVLIDVDSNFNVKSTSTPEQNIEEFGFTEWNWVVKPIKSGDHPLRLLIKVRIFTENGDYLKDIPVYDKNVKVHSNVKWSILQWVKSYWQWLFSTIIIPIFIYFWKRRKKKKENQ